jgi:hypothetical protein
LRGGGNGVMIKGIFATTVAACVFAQGDRYLFDGEYSRGDCSYAAANSNFIWIPIACLTIRR